MQRGLLAVPQCAGRVHLPTAEKTAQCLPNHRHQEEVQLVLYVSQGMHTREVTENEEKSSTIVEKIALLPKPPLSAGAKPMQIVAAPP
eukprot:scaffold9235_cov31-Tisochrysis_lutea.AAC.3